MGATVRKKEAGGGFGLPLRYILPEFLVWMILRGMCIRKLRCTGVRDDSSWFRSGTVVITLDRLSPGDSKVTDFNFHPLLRERTGRFDKKRSVSSMLGSCCHWFIWRSFKSCCAAAIQLAEEGLTPQTLKFSVLR